jgi:RNA-binding protein 26
MLFDEAHTDDIKAWLTSELGPICDADPEVLADYVLALLKHEGPEEELQSMLTEQLEDFLAAETEPFVTKVFAALTDKSYLPQAQAQHAQESDNAQLAASESTSSLTADASRKRRADDDADASTRSPPRQSRRVHDSSAASEDPAARGRERDSRERHDNGDANGASGEGSRREPRKQLCRDYHNKGFCPRGDKCKFEHSSSVLPGAPNPRQQPAPYHLMGPGPGGPSNGMQGPPMMFQGAPYGMPPQGWHPSMGPAPGMPGGPTPPGAPSQTPGMNGDAQNLANRMGHPQQGPDAGGFAMGAPFNGPGGRGGGMGGRGRGRGGGPPGTFQSSRRSNTTLVIENVPADSLDLIKVNEYFKKFGTITNISIDQPGSKALVSYSQPGEAKAAHESPDVIFGNRFVKVYFQRLDEAAGTAPTPRPPPSAAGHAPGSHGAHRGGFVPGKSSNVYHARPPTGGAGAGAAAGGMSEERKKLFEDQRTKQAALDAQLAEQKSLLANFGNKDLSADDKKATMAKLKKLGEEIKASTEAVKAAVEALQAAPKDAGSSAGGDAGNWKAEKEKREKEQLDRELELHAKGTEAGSTTDELKKKLESLKAEAASLGIDGAQQYGYGGRGRGRGGFVPRGRGGYAPYARGGGTANRSLRIDNRTTRIKIESLPEGVDADKVRAHFAAFGELDSFDPAAATVVYKARNSAEQAIRAGAEIADVGAVKLSWIQPPPTEPVANNAPAADADQQSTPREADDEDDRDSNWKR